MIGKALVTGGAGFVGSYLVGRLVDEGTEVLVVDDLSTGKLERLAEPRRMGGLRIHQMDVTSPDMVRAAQRFGPEIVFHLAANASVSRSVDDPMHDGSVNVLGTLNAAIAARDSGAERMVYVSSAAIYGDPKKLPIIERAPRAPMSPYGVSKHVAEAYLGLFREQHGTDYTVVVPANIYGPGQDAGGEGGVVAIFIRSMITGRRPTIFGDGTNTRDFVYVEDVVDGLILAAYKGGGKVYHLSTGTETSVSELYGVVARLTGYPEGPGAGAPRPGDVARSALDPAAAKRHLDWQAWTPFETGLRRTVDWFR